MKRTIKFWTSEEDKAINTCMGKFNGLREASEWLSPRINRTPKAIYVRMCNMKLNNGKVVGYKKPERSPKVENKGINIPSGFTFDIKPSKAVMFTDHVRLYF